jgi:DNA-damage-inducible protein D
MAKLEAVEYETFETIKQTDESGLEFWYARDLQKALNYDQWRDFSKVINRAKLACKNSGFVVADNFFNVKKVADVPQSAEKQVNDYKLTRYACYLIVMNGDPQKKTVAQGQMYIAMKTRRQEIRDYSAHLFCLTQTDGRLKKEKIADKDTASRIHYQVGKEVRNAIERIGGTMPENLPTPEKSIQTVEREEIRKLRNSKTKLMLDE